ncbi:MAG: hypothetical protein DRO39_06105, partial [Thermoprotei archaeon]
MSKGVEGLPELEEYISYCRSSLRRLLRGVFVVDLSSVSIAGAWRKVNGYFVLELHDGSLLDNYVTWFRRRVLAFMFLVGFVERGSPIEIPRRGVSIS